MKIIVSSLKILDQHYRKFLDLNKQRIIAFRFSNQSRFENFIDLNIVDSSFLRLESLTLTSASTFELLNFLLYLQLLPHLSSITIQAAFSFDDLGDIYQTTFQLSLLKYFKLKLAELEPLEINIPFTYINYFSFVKYLAIHHCVTFNQIVNLLKYLPLLIYLSCDWIMQAFNNVKVDAIIQVDYLTHLDVIIQDIHFNEFERFLKLFYNLNVLRIEICAHDSAY
jgi:hypothetical protein